MTRNIRARHQQDGAARDLLHFAALLHDVGAVVGYGIAHVLLYEYGGRSTR